MKQKDYQFLFVAGVYVNIDHDGFVDRFLVLVDMELKQFYVNMAEDAYLQFNLEFL